MLLNEKQVYDIILQLLKKSEAQEVAWNLLQDDVFFLVLPNGVSASLRRAPEDQGRIDFVLLAGPNAVIGEFKADMNAQAHRDLQRLLECARAYVSTRAAAAIIDAVKGAGVVGQPIVSGGIRGSGMLSTSAIVGQQVFPYEAVLQPIQPIVSAPPLVPSAEESRAFFTRISGQWQLDFGHGKESVRIDNEGRYFIGKESQPAFMLRLLAATRDYSFVEMAKDKVPDGRRFQIEVLRVSDREMIGEAKHDRHRLHYTKR
jgi:hypothetical protein